MMEDKQNLKKMLAKAQRQKRPKRYIKKKKTRLTSI